MGQTVEQSVVNPTYLEFFGLTQPPFARLTDPSQLFSSEQYSILMEHLTHARANADSLVVVCGADGSGKSTLLNRFVTDIDDHIICVAINKTCQGEQQFYRTVLKQIGFEEITGTANELRNITKEFLVCRGVAGDHVLVIVDNAHLADPVVLEQIRRLCEIKIKDRRVLSVILAGNADIVRVVDAPAMRQTKFHSHVVFSIRNYSEEETASYIWHRLRLAGGSDCVKLPDETIGLIHRYSGGIPHLINRLCDDMLAESCSLESRVVTEKIVRTVADKQQLVPHVVPLHGQGRRRTDPDFGLVRAVPETARADSENAQQLIAELSVQLGDLRADKARALEDCEARNEDIVALRNELDSRTAEVEKLAHSLAASADEITRQSLALSTNATALRDSENRSEKLAADLEHERSAREAAQSELADASGTVRELSQLKEKLEATVDDVHSDLKAGSKVADEISAEVETLKKTILDLKGEVDGRTSELDSLRHELAVRDEVRADLEIRLEESQRECESVRRQVSALKDPEELEEVERASSRLAADLGEEIRARKAAQKELVQVTATVEELRQVERELQTTVRGLSADLRVASERAVDIYMLERNVADLQEETGKLMHELDSRNQALADLQQQFDVSRQENERLRRGAAATDENAVEAPVHTTHTYSSQVVTKFEQSISGIPAYQALRKHDSASYDGLVVAYEKLVGQDLTEKQVNDALRTEQTALMERLLPRASDEAIISYARVIIEQLDELQLDGVEPCLTLLVPQSDPEDDARPVYSEKTRERELDTMEMTLRTYKADRPLPAEEDVWPNLGPIFSELFGAFGADNVAAMQNSYDPAIDRILVCNVSRALYSGILNFPKRKAAKALRWLLST